MENLCEDVYEKMREKYTNVDKHSSVNGLHYIKSNDNLKFIFIEFKQVNLGRRGVYKKTIEDLKIKLKLKPLETLTCVFQHLIEHYSKKKIKMKLILYFLKLKNIISWFIKIFPIS